MNGGLGQPDPPFILMSPESGSRSPAVQEPQIERPEYQDYSDVHHQPLPQPIPEEQDIHADYDGHQREHVKHDSYLSSHLSFLVHAAELGHSGA